ncbi:MAG: sulfotransferase [Anaerolineae bacterium]|nr:sulfotransferase [Anaerolineae bacterium]
MESDNLKVLFIAGSGRSGSTILHSILGQIDGFLAVGELRYIWERGLIKNQLCGCGVPLRECEMWNSVMTEAFGGIDQVDAKTMSQITESFRIKDMPLSLLPNVRDKHRQRLNGYLSDLENFYWAIQSTTGSRVIIDSSKNPSYGYVLQMIPTIDMYILHVIRDSQAVAYSWSKVKYFEPGHRMARKSPLTSALQWDAHNLTAEIFLKQEVGRYMQLRYEDFVINPQASVEAIVNLIGENGATLPFSAPDIVQLQRVNHSVFGNPVRFQNGPVRLRVDSRWQSKMSQKDKLTVKTLTWPLRLKYRYFLSGVR